MKKKFPQDICVVLILVTGMWAFVNLVEVTGALIVLAHQSGYEEHFFTVERVYHRSDHESGFSWGLEGSVLGNKARLFAPEMRPEKEPNYKALLESFPVRSKIAVWYNPKVTGTLFQPRSLNVIPFTEDFPKDQYRRIFNWLVFCLLPFALSVFVVKKIKTE